ncbi:hypothetical protein ABEB36_004967 [Hypothenemus hampei]
MQRCPYIHEMKERLLGEQTTIGQIQSTKKPQLSSASKIMTDQQQPLLPPQPVGTVVKLNPDGYGSHTSPTHIVADHRTPLTKQSAADGDDNFGRFYHRKLFPKNAKTSLFIIMSFVYAKLLVVVCIAYVFSDVVTHNIPLYYYEGFFTYLYGMSILFLLYVFCFLLQESSCCAGSEKVEKVKPPPKQKPKDKEKELKKEEEEKKKKKEKEKEEKKKKDKEKDKEKKSKKQEKQKASTSKTKPDGSRDPDFNISFSFEDIKSTTYRRNSEGVVDAEDVVPVPVIELTSPDRHRHHSSQGPGSQQQQQQEGPPPPQPPPPPTNASGTNNVDVESGAVVQQHQVQKTRCKRKTTQSEHSHGSFFLRIGAIAFGLGTMIYNGLEFGVFFEIPFTSPCYMILRGVNPLLQMIFTFMQMYFIFMNSRLNIHRFKVVARFGLMHVVATNLCVWIRTLVLEYIKEITIYHRELLKTTLTLPTTTLAPFAESIKQHALRNANTVLGTHVAKPDLVPTLNKNATSLLKNFVSTTARTVYPYFNNPFAPGLSTPKSSIFTTSTTAKNALITTAKSLLHPQWRSAAPFANQHFHNLPTTIAPRTIATTLLTKLTTTTTTTLPTTLSTLKTTVARSFVTPTTTAPTTSTMGTAFRTFAPSTYGTIKDFFDLGNFNSIVSNDVANVAEESEFSNEFSNAISENGTEFLDNLTPQAFIRYFTKNFTGVSNDSCGRINIMGTIVQDSAPYLFPFIIEYSLIGAAVIYCIWKHIGRYPRYETQEDLEHRLELMLSRRAVAIAQAQQGRVDCVGASKGLFFGLLMLVASLICLILFFVLVHHKELGLLAIYLADVSHCVLMILSIIAIIIGFIRVQNLKFRTEEQSDLNDILLRVSAFGLFTYAVFSVIAGHYKAFTVEPNMLVMVTGILSVAQVILQLLFIADVSRRRVHLPEHDRTKPGRQVVTFLLICNITMWIIYTFETQKVEANPVQKRFYGFLTWAIVQRLTLPLCIFHRFHSAVTLAEIWKTSYKARLE